MNLLVREKFGTLFKAKVLIKRWQRRFNDSRSETAVFNPTVA